MKTNNESPHNRSDFTGVLQKWNPYKLEWEFDYTKY